MQDMNNTNNQSKTIEEKEDLTTIFQNKSEESNPNTTENNSSEKINIDELKPVEITQEAINEEMIKKASIDANSELDAVITSMDSKLNEETDRVNTVETNMDGDVKNTTYQELTENKPEANSEENFSGIDIDDFMPGYGDDNDKSKDEDEKNESIDDIDIASLPQVQLEHNPKTEEIFIGEIKNVRITATQNPNLKSAGDQSFMNSINRYRKDVNKTMTMPLINSGFSADIVGGGILDLILMYSGSRDRNEIDYELDKMKTMMKSIVGTKPSIKRETLASSIHYIDYQMMSFGYVCGTLNEIVVPHTCTGDCKKDFKITANPADLILNIDEIADKVAALANVNEDNYHKSSLLGYIKNLIFEKGVKISVCHPSFYDMVHLLNSVKQISSKDPIEGGKYASMVSVISFIKNVILPGGEMTSNGYQVYKALSLLNEEEFKVLKNAIKVESEKIVQPRFGIKSVTCPICGTVHNDIEINNLDELVFFHIMATQQTK